MYRKNAWLYYNDEDKKNVFDFANDYKTFLSTSKTERLAVSFCEETLKKHGFKDIKTLKNVKENDKIYCINKNKNIIACVIGKKPLEEGLRIVASHIDSPRLDLKENPFYCSKGFAYGNTHYYGGIKKYHYVATPLSLHGVIVKKSGEVVDVHIGDEEDDPVVGISDLLIHLSADQLNKPLAKAIEGENLDITLGNIPLSKDKDAKSYILKLLKDKYHVDEEDFLSSEIEVVPSSKARDYGLDRSMIMGYGHDDRCCAYSSLRAILEVNNPTYTSICYLVDKEEIGSVGSTGAQSYFFENTIAKILTLHKEPHPLWAMRMALENSKLISSDVSAAYDPLYSNVFDADNSCQFAYGVSIEKYTGARGKSGSNDAEPEYYAWLRNIFDKNNVFYQSGELGKVDQGGGGTIAGFLAKYNAYTIDVGIPVLNMHSLYEVISKVDLYEAYKGYLTFFRN